MTHPSNKSVRGRKFVSQAVIDKGVRIIKEYKRLESADKKELRERIEGVLGGVRLGGFNIAYYEGKSVTTPLVPGSLEIDEAVDQIMQLIEEEGSWVKHNGVEGHVKI